MHSDSTYGLEFSTAGKLIPDYGIVIFQLPGLSQQYAAIFQVVGSLLFSDGWVSFPQNLEINAAPVRATFCWLVSY
jgi:hypothetical protein